MRLTIAILVALAGVACDDPVVVGDPAQQQQAQQQVPTPEPVPMENPEEVEQEQPADYMVTYTDEDFVEVDVTVRDPFRSFATLFRQQATSVIQRDVVMPTTAIDEMRLIAIITGVARPRAMLKAPGGVGHTVRIGQYVGRPEVIQTGGADSMPVTLNWRVARIRAGEVVLTREDPTGPDRPPLTRVIPLYEEGEDPLELRRRALERQNQENEQNETL